MPGPATALRLTGPAHDRAGPVEDGPGPAFGGAWAASGDRPEAVRQILRRRRGLLDGAGRRPPGPLLQQAALGAFGQTLTAPHDSSAPGMQTSVQDARMPGAAGKEIGGISR
ncbi:hypothetical protein GCM10018966_008160 [Streptomyces yanii]